MSDKRELAALIGDIETLVRQVISNPGADELDIDVCRELAVTIHEHWDAIIKPTLRRAL